VRRHNLGHLVMSLKGVVKLQACVRRRIMQRRFRQLRTLALILQRLALPLPSPVDPLAWPQRLCCNSIVSRHSPLIATSHRRNLCLLAYA
jgi:hypothetical protein